MTLQENISRIKEVMSQLTEETKGKQKKKTVSIKGEVLDLSKLPEEKKEELKLREKVIVDKKNMEYPIVMVQLADGKVIVFDVDGSVRENETSED
jgi:thymidine phosphorylase